MSRPIPLPTLFLSHGSPMRAVDPGSAGAAWKAIADTLPRPRAVLMVSAHWETGMPMVTANAKPETIHDFGGFPDALYRLRYPAPGAPQLAARVVELLKAAGITAGQDGCRGLDHGAWVPMMHMYPAHDVPVAQLAVQPGRDTAHHLALGRALAPLAHEGVLVIGSGHVTHNLRDWVGHRGGSEPLPYAASFAHWLHDTLAQRDERALLAYRERGPGGARAHPSEEHFLPIYVAWGAAGPDALAERVYEGYDGPALSMDAYAFGSADAVRLATVPATP
ncbi:MAG TPA: class III extradiol ring-cleavage dioxygenase [Casimicrobiaceae bacterium]|nr:class III extradiol ring-cleavage dioxygenase [Casimicrobiaceae bacterium]